MPRRSSLVMVVALFTLLVFGTSAHAACAWVLWDRTTGQEWETRNGFSDEASCKRAAHLWLSRVHGTAVPPEVEAVERNGRMYRVQCLPDTVDPRAGPRASDG